MPVTRMSARRRRCRDPARPGAPRPIGNHRDATMARSAPNGVPIAMAVQPGAAEPHGALRLRDARAPPARRRLPRRPAGAVRSGRRAGRARRRADHGEDRRAFASARIVGSTCCRASEPVTVPSSSSSAPRSAAARSASVCPGARSATAPSPCDATTSGGSSSRKAGVRNVMARSDSRALRSPGSRTIPTTSRSKRGPSGSYTSLGLLHGARASGPWSPSGSGRRPWPGLRGGALAQRHLEGLPRGRVAARRPRGTGSARRGSSVVQ